MSDEDKLTPECKRILLQVRDHILEEPKRMDMSEWIMDGEAVLERGLEVPKCGTIACIAGWVAVLGPRPRGYLSYDVCGRAQQLLGLTDPEVRRLFRIGGWPNPLAHEILAAKPQTREYAEVVARRITTFIDSEGAI